MLSIICKCHYAEYCYARCILLSVIMLIVVDKLSVIEMIVDVPNLSVNCCRYAECFSTECCGAKFVLTYLF